MQFAAAAVAVVHGAGRRCEDVDVVGSHGLTFWHRPPRRPREIGATLQLGNPAPIAERTGAVVVSDFRSADVAAGGQGAPLIAYLDWLLYRDEPGSVLLNLGGIANLTFVTSELEDVVAFDTGPANLPLDYLMRSLTQGRSAYDDGGRVAATGHVDAILLDQLLEHPYLHRAPPKTTGREEFGETWCAEVARRHRHLKLIDILATVTAFVAHAVYRACRDYLPQDAIRRLRISGGGVHNLTLMNHLERLFAPVPVEPVAGRVDPDAKEAILFALLANDRLFGHPTNVPSATGARWPVSLGQVIV